MAAMKPPGDRKFFSVTQANTMLPLVRAIVRDVTELASDLGERQARMARVRSTHGRLSDASQEELQHIQEELERDQERLQGYADELNQLGVFLKDLRVGLIDFPCWMDDHEVYLCWRLGEPEVAFWHEIDAGFQGRQKLLVDSAK